MVGLAVTRPAPTRAALTAAAFGADPGRWPLPPAETAGDRWLRAVAAAGQGRYRTARAELAVVLGMPNPGPIGSLARSALGSFLRQLGRHRDAAGWDGAAAALAGSDPEAGIDALAGLAADALGVGRLGAAAALLARADALHSGGSPPRLGVRLAWVHAELAMAGGDGARALVHAERAVDLAGRAAPALRRHRVKSDLVLAAALGAAGDAAAARRRAEAVLADAGTDRLEPLRWAASCLLEDLGSSTHDAAEVVRIRKQAAGFVERHGGRWEAG
jgi:hypothetical protein